MALDWAYCAHADGGVGGEKESSCKAFSDREVSLLGLGVRLSHPFFRP